MADDVQRSELRRDPGKEEHYVREALGTHFSPLVVTEYDVLCLRLNFIDDVWHNHDTAFFSVGAEVPTEGK